MLIYTEKGKKINSSHPTPLFPKNARKNIEQDVNVLSSELPVTAAKQNYLFFFLKYTIRVVSTCVFGGWVWFLDSLKLKSTVWPVSFSHVLMGGSPQPAPVTVAVGTRFHSAVLQRFCISIGLWQRVS